MGKKATANPLGNVPTIDDKLCLFCNGKELATISVTGMGYPMGDKCWDKSIKKNVNWDENTSLKTLKHLLRFGLKG
jgi:hypothetical protein